MRVLVVNPADLVPDLDFRTVKQPLFAEILLADLFAEDSAGRLDELVVDSPFGQDSIGELPHRPKQPSSKKTAENTASTMPASAGEPVAGVHVSSRSSENLAPMLGTPLVQPPTGR